MLAKPVEPESEQPMSQETLRRALTGALQDDSEVDDVVTKNGDVVKGEHTDDEAGALAAACTVDAYPEPLSYDEACIKPVAPKQEE